MQVCYIICIAHCRNHKYYNINKSYYCHGLKLRLGWLWIQGDVVRSVGDIADCAGCHEPDKYTLFSNCENGGYQVF